MVAGKNGNMKSKILNRQSLNGDSKGFTLNEDLLGDMVENAIHSRAALIKRLTDPRRDIDDECGYPNTSNLDAKQYQEIYEREPVAARAVKVFPEECWGVSPCVYEEEDEETETKFEKAFKELSQYLTGMTKDVGQQSWLLQEKGSPVWSYLKRADQLSGIGHFGVIVLGLNDGRALDQPVRGFTELNSMPIDNVKYGKRGKKKRYSPKMTKNTFKSAKNADKSMKDVPQYSFEVNLAKDPRMKLVYMRVFSESLVEIHKYESNPSSPRFGQPVLYSITFNDPRDIHMGTGIPTNTVDVHWTRVIHIADNLENSEIFGIPRLRPILNPILDIRKVRGGSAEMYWRGAFPGLSFETNPNLGTDVSIDRTAMKEMAENYMNGLQRYLALSGMTAKSLAPQVVDPTQQLEAQIEAICIYLGIPMRVFKGSERGQLASNQDDTTWNERLKHRQHFYITPRIIAPFVDRLILIGVLPKPKSGEYMVYWPDFSSQTDKEKTVISVGRTKAISQFHKDGLENKMTFLDFLVRILMLDTEEAKTIIKNRKEEPLPKITDPALKPKPLGASLGKNGKPTAKRGGTSGEDKVPSKVRTKVARYGRRKSQDYAGDTTTRA